MKKLWCILAIFIILLLILFTWCTRESYNTDGCADAKRQGLLGIVDEPHAGDWCNTCTSNGCGYDHTGTIKQWDCMTGTWEKHSNWLATWYTANWSGCQDLAWCPNQETKNCGGHLTCCKPGESCEACMDRHKLEAEYAPGTEKYKQYMEAMQRMKDAMSGKDTNPSPGPLPGADTWKNIGTSL